MNKKKMTVLAVTAALILVFAIFISFYRTYIQGIDEPILPPAEPTAPPDPIFVSSSPASPSPSPEVVRIEVSAENVQTVLSTLSRPSAYSMKVSVETIWAGGSGIETKQIWVKDGFSKIEALNSTGYAMEHAIICPDKVYIWLQGTALPFEGSVGDFTPDSKLRIPSYEKIMSLPAEEIEAADFVLAGDVPCIYVRLKPNKLSYIEEFWISTETGLLFKAEIADDEKTTYRMTSDSFSPETPSNDKFTLPNGQLVIS